MNNYVLILCLLSGLLTLAWASYHIRAYAREVRRLDEVFSSLDKQAAERWRTK